VRGVGGVSMRFTGCMGWGFGRISGGDDGSSLDTRLEVNTLKLIFGMMCGAGIRPSRQFFQTCLVWLL
jgi:hypothetical protein